MSDAPKPAGLIRAVIDKDTCAACRAADGSRTELASPLPSHCDKVRDGTGICRCIVEPQDGSNPPGPAGTWCPVCGLYPQARGCEPGNCKTSVADDVATVLRGDAGAAVSPLAVRVARVSTDMVALLRHVAAEVLPGEYGSPDGKHAGIAEAAQTILDDIDNGGLMGKAVVLRVEVHPEREEWADENFDGLIIVDPELPPNEVRVTPYAYAEHIKCTVGLANDETKAPG